jgi:hypothetical protein
MLGGRNIERLHYPSHGIFGRPETGRSVEFSPTPAQNDFKVNTIDNNNNDNCFEIVGRFIAGSIYTFRAERLSLASHMFGDSSVLLPNAENLPVVLNILQGQPELFARFNSLVRQVFPSIRYVTVQPRRDNLIIMIWNADAPADRTDLAIELSESGTGVGQVLAMLYVVVTSRSPRTILIDEPNIFLHSGAIRKLIEIMRTDPIGHQYIITTHSPDIIRVSDAQRVYLVERQQEQSSIHGISPSEITSFRRTLLEVGTRLSDLLGADNVVWVEGPTEEECFPKIIRARTITAPPGLAVLAVRATGDFEGRRASAVAIWEIYNRLTTVGTLMPTNIAISLDKEDRSASDIARAKEKSRGLMHFLPRRCFENYLVHPYALAAVLNTLPTFSETVVTQQAVETWLQDHGGDAKYGARKAWEGDLHNERWLVEIKGAVLLSDLFQTLSGAKDEYRKVTHGAALTEWICENDLEHFAGLSHFIQELLH